MKSAPRVLLLTGSYGNGHLQVVRTIARQFQETGIHRLAVVDLFAEAHPFITKLTRYLYIKSFTVGKQVYGKFYYSSQHMDHSDLMAKWLNAFGSYKLAEIIANFQPDIIINTFPMLTVPVYKARTGSRIPTYNILTDYGLHNRWTHPLVDRYYVASDRLKAIMTDRGIPAESVVVSGIPVDVDFERAADRDMLCREQGLDPNKEYIVIMAGAYGVLQNTDRIVNELAHDDARGLVIVCGHNRKLKQKLDGAFGHMPNVRILGYVHQMDKLMKIASVMVTKPGGITLTEALHTRLPLVLYRPVPGQEQENALYFQEEGAAILVNDIDSLIRATRTVLGGNDQYKRALKQNMARLCQLQSAERICHDVLQHYTKHCASTRNPLSVSHKVAQ